MTQTSLVAATLCYACNAWYRGLSKQLQIRLQTAQNKAMRYVLDYENRKHIGFSDFCKLKWLNISKRVDYFSLCMMYRVHSGTAPKYLCDLKPVSHRYRTRQYNQSYQLPNVKSQGSKTFKYSSIKLWNELPSEIKKLA